MVKEAVMIYKKSFEKMEKVKFVRISHWSDREREREEDGGDVTIVALKLAMSLHFPLPKIRTWR